jgi:unconventional prefoldin RPB5 interactor 1
MAQRERDPLSDLERLRQTLEDNVRKLRLSLQHWQTWEAEYEGLKEEVESISCGDEPTPEQLRKVGKEYEGDLVNEKGKLRC